MINKPDESRAFWTKFLTTTGELTNDEWKKAYDMANNWDTCACGSLDITTDGYPMGTPDDTRLNELGQAFLPAVKHRNLKRARIIFNAVQARAKNVYGRRFPKIPTPRGEV